MTVQKAVDVWINSLLSDPSSQSKAIWESYDLAEDATRDEIECCLEKRFKNLRATMKHSDLLQKIRNAVHGEDAGSICLEIAELLGEDLRAT